MFLKTDCSKLAFNPNAHFQIINNKVRKLHINGNPDRKDSSSFKRRIGTNSLKSAVTGTSKERIIREKLSPKTISRLRTSTTSSRIQSIDNSKNHFRDVRTNRLYYTHNKFAATNQKGYFNDDSTGAYANNNQKRAQGDDLLTIHGEVGKSNGTKPVCENQENVNLQNDNQINSECESSSVKSTQLYTQEIVDGITCIKFKKNIHEIITKKGLQCDSVVEDSSKNIVKENVVNCDSDHCDAIVRKVGDDNTIEQSPIDAQIPESDTNKNCTTKYPVVQALSLKDIFFSYPKNDDTTTDNIVTKENTISNDAVSELKKLQRIAYKNALNDYLKENLAHYKSGTDSVKNSNDKSILCRRDNELYSIEETGVANQNKETKNTVDLQKNKNNANDGNNLKMSNSTTSKEKSIIQSTPENEKNDSIISGVEAAKKYPKHCDTLLCLKRISEGEWMNCPSKKRFKETPPKSIKVMENHIHKAKRLLNKTARQEPIIQPSRVVLENHVKGSPALLNNSIQLYEDISNDEVIDKSCSTIASLSEDNTITPSVIPSKNTLQAPSQIGIAENSVMPLIDVRSQSAITRDAQTIPRPQPQRPRLIEACCDPLQQQQQKQQQQQHSQSTLRSFLENPTNVLPKYRNLMPLRNPVNLDPYPFVPPNLSEYSVSALRSLNVQNQMPTNNLHLPLASTVQQIQHSRPRIIPNNPNIAYSSSNGPISEWYSTSFPPPPPSLRSQLPANESPPPPQPRKMIQKPISRTRTILNPAWSTTTSLIQNEESNRNDVQQEILSANPSLNPLRFSDAPHSLSSNSVPFYPLLYGGGRYFANPQVYTATQQQQYYYRQMQESYARMMTFQPPYPPSTERLKPFYLLPLNCDYARY